MSSVTYAMQWSAAGVALCICIARAGCSHPRVTPWATLFLAASCCRAHVERAVPPPPTRAVNSWTYTILQQHALLSVLLALWFHAHGTRELLLQLVHTAVLVRRIIVLQRAHFHLYTPLQRAGLRCTHVTMYVAGPVLAFGLGLAAVHDARGPPRLLPRAP